MAARNHPGIGLIGGMDLYDTGWNIPVNANWLKLSTLVQCTALSRATSLPASPSNGQIFIVPNGGNAGKIAVRDNDSWTYFTPLEGFIVAVADENTVVIFNGAAWVTMREYLSLGNVDNTADVNKPVSTAQAAAITAAISALSLFGEGQTWKNSTKNANQAYQNTSDAPIMLAFSYYNGRAVYVSSDGVDWVTLPGGYWNNSSYYSPANTVIPPGHYYKFSWATVVAELS